MACKEAGGTDGKVLRVVLLGKTGMGKSSLGNTLLDKKDVKAKKGQAREQRPAAIAEGSVEGFTVARGMTSETLKCSWGKAFRHGITLEVTDTPGLCDTHKKEKQIFEEVAKSVAVAEPGPNVIIFVLRSDRRFSPEEYGAFEKIKALFSEEMKKFLILVFNGIDELGDEGDTIEELREALVEEIKKFGEPLQSMLQEAGGRYLGINNRAPPPVKERQVLDLIQLMQGVVQSNSNEHYRTEMTDEIMKRVEELTRDEAKGTGLSQAEATNNVKRKIVEEKVSPGFFGYIFSAVAKAAKSVSGGIADMCSVM